MSVVKKRQSWLHRNGGFLLKASIMINVFQRLFPKGVIFQEYVYYRIVKRSWHLIMKLLINALKQHTNTIAF